MKPKHLILAAIPALFAAPAGAASYVVCDNGLRCVVAPCPSTNALNVATGSLRKGVWVDVTGMSPRDQREIARRNALYEGTLVISGRLEQRMVKSIGGPKSLPFVVGERLGRRSTASERRLCRR